MPVLRLNAGTEGPVLHGSPASAMRIITSAALGSGPVIVMIHGYKYDPYCAKHSPHASIFAGPTRPVLHKKVQWLHHLGFGSGDPNEGLAIPFAWRARGSLWRAQRAARLAGQQLADVITAIHQRAPRRPIHVVTHSMGSEVIFEALFGLPANSIDRIVTLTGASYASRAADALQQSKAGRTAALINVTSRENDPFDFLYERLIPPPQRGDLSLGRGIDLPNAVTLRLDCARTLAQLAQCGGHIAAPSRRICHWSGYTRPGAMRFYAHALRHPDAVPLSALQQTLPATVGPRWTGRLALSRDCHTRPQDHHPNQDHRKVT